MTHSLDIITAMISRVRPLSDYARNLSVSRFGIYRAQGRRLGEFLCELWTTAGAALAVPADQISRTTRELRELLPSWANELIGPAPLVPSYVAADGFPAEMSVNWSGVRPELRVLFDCLCGVGDDEDYDLPDSDSDPRSASVRFGRISEIFTTRAGRPCAAPLWHSMAWRPPDHVIHKSYFGLYRWPLAERYAAVGAAMARLGMATAWRHARERAERRTGRRREIEFFGLDLPDTSGARVKIYYRNHDADVAELNEMAAVARTHDPHTALAAYRTLTGPRADAGDAPLTCLAFRSGLDTADESTTYLRMPSLAATDQEAVDRVAALLRHEQLDPRPFRELAAALAPGPLGESLGVLELVSHRAARRRGDITTYFRFPVYDGPAPEPAHEVDLAQKEPAVPNPDLNRVADYNSRRQAEYEASELIRLLADEQTPYETRRAVLTYLQPWSNAFQRMISARVTYESDPALRILALEHQKEEIGHDTILARSRSDDQRLVWDPVIESGASWFVDQFATLPGVARAVLAHLALEAGSLALSKAGVRAFPDDEYFSLHDEADAEHLDMGYRLLEERSDWTAESLIEVLDRAWQVITVVSDRIAECALRDTAVAAV